MIIQANTNPKIPLQKNNLPINRLNYVKIMI